MPPPGWQNPIAVSPRQTQSGVDPLSLLPARSDLERSRVQFQRGFQRGLLVAGTPRYTPIRVTTDGVIVDGHHAVRAAAEDGRLVSVLVVRDRVPATADSIMDLPLV
jgi:hypothetical protein